MTQSRPSLIRRIGRFLGRSAFFLTLALVAGLTATALTVHVSGPALYLAEALLAAAALSAALLRLLARRAAWAMLVMVTLIAGLWYQTIIPCDDRTWAPDVAHGVTAEIDGDRVTLTNVRNFRWTSEDAATEVWESRSYDLSKLASVDMLTSVWDSPDIAHLLVSFGFEDGEHVTFSVEIRKEMGEKFSTLGGFFRQFELVLIAADEEDIVKLRTNYRGETVSLYPLTIGAEGRRQLFLSYLDLGNRLAARPAFYNTVTSNCASTVYRTVGAFKEDVPLDIRLLKTGLLPEYLADLGYLDPAIAAAPATITARAQTLPQDIDFSAGIRVR
ncbi:DUF4105 domain-containing protein [Frigidibacter sp. RF13]|uniref:Lnb N-terminal periplasmic domain-containing protein n=1 Tax=Frigidibacter sp. RF13 TaxID=2997340 RepID=UPI00226E0090|nr:DUF4105 domain-containing protein [Frigidibacter sp. RF13]MCY1126869.1 DUF4105 domain-containing protein [Frigidibacter sp. RF13]